MQKRRLGGSPDFDVAAACLADGSHHARLVYTSNRQFPRGDPTTTERLVRALDALHEVELGGPRVPQLDGVRLDPVFGEDVVLRTESLRDDVVDVERDSFGIGAEGDDRENSPSTRALAKSPIVTSMCSPPGFARNRATMASELSMPATRTPRSASGSAIRPVPIPNSSAPPCPARSASI